MLGPQMSPPDLTETELVAALWGYVLYAGKMLDKGYPYNTSAYYGKELSLVHNGQGIRIVSFDTVENGYGRREFRITTDCFTQVYYQNKQGFTYAHTNVVLPEHGGEATFEDNTDPWKSYFENALHDLYLQLLHRGWDGTVYTNYQEAMKAAAKDRFLTHVRQADRGRPAAEAILAQSTL